MNLAESCDGLQVVADWILKTRFNKDVEVNPAPYAYAVDTDICNFETTLRNAALKLACGLSAKTYSQQSLNSIHTFQN